ncbi:MAG: STAS domain-containing protein [Acetobacter sp.]|nr:STAS domain-containing protein [Acetobacter sp.]
MSEASSAPQGSSLALTGRLDSAAATGLKETLEKALADHTAVSLDVSGVTYIGGLCLQLLLASGCSLFAPSEQVKEAYTLFGLAELLPE